MSRTLASFMHSPLFAMSAASAPVIAVFGITLYVGLHHLLTWLRVRERRMDLALGFTSLGMAFYDACEIAIFNAPSQAAALPWHRAQMAAIALVGMGLLWSVGALTGLYRRWHWVLHACFAAVAGLFLLDRSSLTFQAPGGGQKVLHYPLLGTVTLHEPVPGPALYLLAGVGLASFCVVLWMAARHFRASRHRHGVGLLAGLLIVLLTVAHDVAVITGLSDAMYLLEFGYLSILVVMSASLTREVASARQARHELHDTRHLLHALLDNSDAVIFVKDLESKYVLVNRRFEEAFGVRQEEVLGKSDYRVYPHEIARELRAADRRVLLSGKPVQVEEHTGDDEERRTWLVTKFPIRGEDGEPVALGGIATDITERARTDAELRRYRDHLEDLVAERTQDLRRARDELLAANQALEEARKAAERAAQAKSRFLATMSHEIRTPLNAVMSMISLVLDGNPTPEQRQHLEVALHSAQGLLRIINDILDYSKLEAERLTLELRPFHLPKLLRELGDMYGTLARAKGLAFRLEVDAGIPAAALGDAGRVRQVLSNLLSNALKFTESGEIRLSAQMDHARTPALVRFDVSDTGVGVPPDKQNTIFQEFSQADQSVTRKYGGTGLGLAICRRIVAQFGGQIALESRPGAGSTFTVWLPLPESHPDMLAPEERDDSPAPAPRATADPHAQEEAEATDASAPDASAESNASPQLRVLLVEDNPLNQKVAVALLRRLGCAVQVCENGQEALEQLGLSGEPGAALPAAPPYDLVLMDWEMPVMDGITATREIRARMPEQWQLPVIGLTANADRSARATCQEAGMNGCLVKPVTLAHLRETLQKIRPRSEQPARQDSQRQSAP